MSGCGLENLKYCQEPDDWALAFKERCKQVGAAPDLGEARTLLRKFQESGDFSLIEQSANILLEHTYFCNDNHESLFLLAFICYMHNRFGEAKKMIFLAKCFEENDVSIIELENEIDRIIALIDGDQNQESLLNSDNELCEALLSALQVIFKKFDLDEDNLLSFTELAHYVSVTNASKLTRDFYDKMVKKYSTNAKGFDFTGFHRFYLEQTLDDPEETRKDLRVHGFDPDLLIDKKIKVPPSA